MMKFVPRKALRILVVLVGLGAAYSLFGFFGVPAILEAKLPEWVGEATGGRGFSIGEARFHPFALRLELRDLELVDLDGREMLKLGAISTDFEWMRSVGDGAWTLGHLRLTRPEVYARVLPDGALNLSGLAPPQEAESETEPVKEEEGLTPVQLDLFQLEEGFILFADEAREEPFQAEFSPLNFALEDLSTLPLDQGHYRLDASWRQARLQWEGELGIAPPLINGSLSLEQISLVNLARFLGKAWPLNAKLSSGFLDIAGHVAFDVADEAQGLQIGNGRLDVMDVALQWPDADEGFLSLPKLSLDGIEIVQGEHSLRAKTLRIENPEVEVRRNAQGVIDLAGLAKPGEEGGPDSEAGESSDEAPSWTAALAELAMTGASVAFIDSVPAPTVETALVPIDLGVRELSWPLDGALPFQLAVGINGEGRLDAEGHLQPEPLAIDVEAELADLALPHYTPYLREFARVLVRHGTLSAKVDASLEGESVTASGEASVAGFSLVDARGRRPLVRWSGLSVTGVDFDGDEQALEISKVALDGPQARFILEADGSSNFSDVVPASQAAPATDSAGPASAPLAFAIGSVQIRDGELAFTDRAPSPAHQIRVADFGGSVSQLSSEEVSRADVDLRGEINGYAPFTLKGQINPLAKDAYTDLAAVVQGLELTGFSPYSGKYVGYGIQKGKLSLDLAYRISEDQLVAENKIVVDQFDFGEAQASPDATKLPVKLAVALLKDGEGKIDVDLPVRGDLNDPEFGYGKVVWRALRKLITTVATSPFAVIGSLVPEGGQGGLESVAFAPGSDALSTEDTQLVGTLAEALSQRPALGLELRGGAHLEVDARVLAERSVRRKLSKRKDELPDVEAEIAAEKGSSLKRMERLFRESQGQSFRAHRKELREERKRHVSAGEEPDKVTKRDVWSSMWETLVEQEEVSDSQLRALASRRATHVLEAFEAAGIEHERIFVLEPNVTAEEAGLQTTFSLAAK